MPCWPIMLSNFRTAKKYAKQDAECRSCNVYAIFHVICCSTQRMFMNFPIMPFHARSTLLNFISNATELRCYCFLATWHVSGHITNLEGRPAVTGGRLSKSMGHIHHCHCRCSVATCFSLPWLLCTLFISSFKEKIFIPLDTICVLVHFWT